MGAIEIENINDWHEYAESLAERKYKPWRYQYSWFDPEGFHSWFGLSGKPDIEVVTHNELIQREIIRYNHTMLPPK